MGRTRTPLPQSLEAAGFTTSAALRAGVPPSRLTLSDLTAPFHGVRVSTEILLSVRARAELYGRKLADGAFFSHATAAVLQNMWLPQRLQEDTEIDVSVFAPGREPRGRGVRGHRLEFRAQQVGSIDGLPVLNHADTWGQLGSMLTIDDLIVAADGLLQHGAASPAARLDALAAAAAVPGRRGRARLLTALPLVRPGVRSPQETRVRLLLLRAGLPEPRINMPIVDDRGRFVAEGDLVYPEARTILEYEGDVHRTDQRTFRKDIHRRERLMDIDWWTIRLIQDDLGIRRAETIERIERTLRRRGMSW